MLLKTFLSSCLTASVVTAHAIRGATKFSCGTPRPSEAQIATSNRLAQKEAEARAAGNFATRATIEVDTYFHVVASSKSESDGYLSDSVLKAQLAVMNSDFAPSGISFNLLNITRTVNSAWANDRSEMEMKKSLRQGDYGTLNVYFQTYASGYLGYCYFPETAPAGSDVFYYDGCTILHSTVPGGSAIPYDLGKTTTHEVGHWFGLYHTFEGGCTGDGDFISDTPVQANETYGCPVSRDSCPSQEGLDPIHNFMDYSDDVCLTEFTAGQAARMASFWNTYRA